MKFVLMLLFLISCNSLEFLAGVKSQIDPNLLGKKHFDTSFFWQSGSTSRSTSPSVSWDYYTDANDSYFELELIPGHGCSSAPMTTISSISLGDNFHQFSSLSNNSDYSAKLSVISIDGAIEQIGCVNVSVNLLPPAPVSLNWAEGTITNNSPIAAQWGSSSSGTVVQYDVNFYSDLNCTVFDSTSAGHGPGILSTQLAGVVNNEEYSFKVKVIESDGDSSESLCSTGIKIDTMAPIVQLPVNTYSAGTVTFDWTSTSDIDVASTQVQAFTDSGCTTQTSTQFTIISPSTTQSITGLSAATTFYLNISQTDMAGNMSSITCLPFNT
jgi:hypothetical protein